MDRKLHTMLNWQINAVAFPSQVYVKLLHKLIEQSPSWHDSPVTCLTHLHVRVKSGDAGTPASRSNVVTGVGPFSGVCLRIGGLVVGVAGVSSCVEVLFRMLVLVGWATLERDFADGFLGFVVALARLMLFGRMLAFSRRGDVTCSCEMRSDDDRSVVLPPPMVVLLQRVSFMPVRAALVINA